MAAAAGAALGGLNPNPKQKPKPNPSANAAGLRSPVALADITNTGRPNPPRSVSVGDVLKENARLVQLLAQKDQLLAQRNKFIEMSSIEMNKFRSALQASRQQNLNLARANSQITAELNQAKDRLKVLQHELACATIVRKLKGSGLERKSSTANDQLQKQVTSQEVNAAPFELAAVEAHQADSKATSADVHNSVETQTSIPCSTVLEEALPAKTNKRTSVSRRTSKRKSESCEGIKDTSKVQPSYKPDMQPPESSQHEDQRNTLRRRSSRLNPGSYEMSEVSCETLHMDTDVPSSSSFSVPELNNANDMQGATQGNTAGHKVKTPVLNENQNEMNKQPEQQVIVEEGTQEVDSRVAAVGDLEAHQNDDKAMDASPNNLPETQSSPQYNIKHPVPPQKRANQRVASKRKLEPSEGQKDSNIEEGITAKLHSTSSEPPHHEDMRKSKRQKSSRSNPVSCEVTEGTLETAQEDIVAPLPPSSSKISTEQSETGKQNARRPSTEPPEEQAAGRSSVEVTGRRSSMRGAAKAVSYKEIPLNVKMRRP
ncbi:shugoshin-1 isoform X2 [Lolium perenne]|uniref:shugoshin-1 isoform X2 n=1 Tax=Lolium perenne TaxID=4522 RepID=UPI0021F5D871|nr:shugoshin-1-like isoform X2 [Lolium perenne]